MIAGSSLIFLKFIWNMSCLCAAKLKFWFQTDLGRKNSASCYRQGRQLLLTFLAMFTRWSRSTSNFYALIGQNQEGVINSSARLSDVSGHRDVTAKWSVRREDFRKWRCFRFLCCHLQNVFLPFGKRQDEFHLIEEVLHLIFQLQRYVDFHNCFKISQKNFLNVCSESSPFAFCVWAKPHVACKFCRYFLMGSMGHLVTWS